MDNITPMRLGEDHTIFIIIRMIMLKYPEISDNILSKIVLKNLVKGDIKLALDDPRYLKIPITHKVLKAFGFKLNLK